MGLVLERVRLLKPADYWEFPGGAVAKIPRSHCRGPGFSPRSGN